MPIVKFVPVSEKRRRGAAQWLFSEYSLFSTLAFQLGALEGEIDGYPTEYLLNVDDERLFSYLETKYRVELPVLNYAATQFSESQFKEDVSREIRPGLRERRIYVDMVSVTLHIPIEGEPDLFNSTPNVRFVGGGGPPEGKVIDGEVQLTYTGEHLSSLEIEGKFEKDKMEIRRVLEYVYKQIAEYQELAGRHMRMRVADRRSRIASLQSGLKFPLRLRSEQNSSSDPILQRKLLPPKSYTEPALEMRQYEEVLQALQHAATAMERAPSAFAQMTEEEIRHHFLIALNTVFSGSAGAETFNLSGKTDILIRVDGRNIFIAECKFWRGKKSFLGAMDQLLGYAAWRDTKTALILLNRGRNLSAILAQIPDLVRQHTSYVRDEAARGETNLRYTVKHPGDPSREILMSVLVFEVPAKFDRHVEE